LAGAAILATMFAFSTAQAQSFSKLVAEIPFDFSVGNKVMPAGQYTISVLNPGSGQKLLRISRPDGHQAVILRTTPVWSSAKNQGTLVFHRYGNQYFLSQIWGPAENYGMEAPASKEERAIARTLDQASRRNTNVAVLKN